MFVSVAKILESVFTAVVYSALLCGCCYKLLGVLQSCGYGGKRFLKWANKKNNLIFTRHVLLALLCAFAYSVIALCFSFAGEWAAVIGAAIYAVMFSLYIWADNRVALRVPVAATPRFKRLYGVLAVIVLIVVYFATTLLNYADYVYSLRYPDYWGAQIFDKLRYCPLAIIPLLCIPFVLLANIVSKIYEVPHNKSFVKKARAKLSASKITVIGITGSYGKTSAKNVLAAILKEKFRVLATPRSHNTPMGIALSINGNNLSDYDIFIAEMGARNIGDIAELCEICPPDYSVITGICPQHLESFGSIENIVKAKAEILAYTKNEAVIAADCYSLFDGYSCKKSRCGEITEAECSPAGCVFAVDLDGEKVTLKTRLLGRHNAENIALAAALAHKLGMSAEEIARAVEKLDFVEHRLQLIKSGGVNILDDGYNSNVKGAAAALEVLQTFEGRKIVVTPGIVELGVLEESENKLLGARLAGLDLVILVGETLVLPVKQGYIEAGGDAEKLLLKPTLDAAQEALKGYIAAGDTVLFLNDLPDAY